MLRNKMIPDIRRREKEPLNNYLLLRDASCQDPGDSYSVDEPINRSIVLRIHITILNAY